MRKYGPKLNLQTKQHILIHSHVPFPKNPRITIGSAKVFLIIIFSSILLTGSLLGTLTIVNPLNQYAFAQESEEDEEESVKSVDDRDEVKDEKDEDEEKETNDNDDFKLSKNNEVEEREEVEEAVENDEDKEEGKEGFKSDSVVGEIKQEGEDEIAKFMDDVDKTRESNEFGENGEKEELKSDVEEDEIKEEDNNHILADNVGNVLDIQDNEIQDKNKQENIGSLQDDKPVYSVAESPDNKKYSEPSKEFSEGENVGNAPPLFPYAVSPIIAQTLPGATVDELSDIDEIFDKNKIKSGPLYELPAPKEVSPTDFKQTKIKNNPNAPISYQDKIMIPALAPMAKRLNSEHTQLIQNILRKAIQLKSA